jgi:hypothetical protein
MELSGIRYRCAEPASIPYVVRGIVMPSCRAAQYTIPEQSKYVGPADPKLYQCHAFVTATFSTRSPSVELVTRGAVVAA